MKSKLYEQILSQFEAAKISRSVLDVNRFRVLVGEIQRLDKDPTEDQVKTVLKKLSKSCNEILDRGCGNPYHLLAAQEELNFYTSFMPQKMSECDLRLLVKTLKVGGTSLGDTMRQLKADYDGQYDGALAAKMYKES